MIDSNYVLKIDSFDKMLIRCFDISKAWNQAPKHHKYLQLICKVFEIYWHIVRKVKKKKPAHNERKHFMCFNFNFICFCVEHQMVIRPWNLLRTETIVQNLTHELKQEWFCYHKISFSCVGWITYYKFLCKMCMINEPLFSKCFIDFDMNC